MSLDIKETIECLTSFIMNIVFPEKEEKETEEDEYLRDTY